MNDALRDFLRHGSQDSLNAYRDNLAQEIAANRCKTCGVTLTDADTIPCKFDYPGARCGADRQ